MITFSQENCKLSKLNDQHLLIYSTNMQTAHFTITLFYLVIKETYLTMKDRKCPQITWSIVDILGFINKLI